MTRASTRFQIALSASRAQRKSPPAALIAAGIAIGGRRTTQTGKWMKMKMRRMASLPARVRWAPASFVGPLGRELALSQLPASAQCLGDAPAWNVCSWMTRRTQSWGTLSRSRCGASCWRSGTMSPSSSALWWGQSCALLSAATATSWQRSCTSRRESPACIGEPRPAQVSSL